MPKPVVDNSIPSAAARQKALTDAALGYLSTLPAAKHLFQPAAGTFNGSETSGGSGTTTTTTAPSAQPLDWRAWLSDWGFPSDVVNELDRIFRTNSDPQIAAQSALAYVRGTDWYSQTFPGIAAGKRLGIVSDEASYRAYTNDLNQLYKRYYNRDITGSEVAGFLGQGKSVGLVSGFLQGKAYVGANRNELQYLLGNFGEGQLNEDQLQTLGEEETGLDSILGQQLDARLQRARARLAGVFRGTLSSPALSFATGKVAAPSLLGGTNDVGA